MGELAMAETIRVGAVYARLPSNTGTLEQLLGVQLAAAHTRQLWGAAGPGLELIEREVATDPAAAEAAGLELVQDHGCAALIEMSTIPAAVQMAEWCEREGVLFMTAHNNPVVREGRRRAFGIGVPSELTGQGTAQFLAEGLKAKRAFVINEPNEFQSFASQCAVQELMRRGVTVERGELLPDAAAQATLVRRVREWAPDAVSLWSGGELDAAVAFVAAFGKGTGVLPPTVFSRSMTCQEFVDRAGAALEGQYFVDMFVRGERASDEERALLAALAEHDRALAPTANHAFGWDGLRLVAEATRAAGPNADAQVAYLEGLKNYPGVTGRLNFAADDHNGHFQANPTTISRLEAGRFMPFSAMNR
jgi:ABC-type branched-subunit amino acid transport system substrate-binding protein